MKALLLGAAIASFSSAAAIRLPGPLTYFDAPAVTSLSQQQAQRLFDVPVRFGADITGAHMVRDGKPARSAATCRQYETDERAGFEPESNFDLAMTGFLVRACGMLDAAVAARPASETSIDSPRIGVRDIGHISSAVLPAAPWESLEARKDDKPKRERTSIATFIKQQGCRVTVATAVELQFRCDDLFYALTELFRADVDGSGDASIVVSPYIRSMTGTFALNTPVVALSRSSRQSLLVPKAIPRRF